MPPRPRLKVPAWWHRRHRDAPATVQCAGCGKWAGLHGRDFARIVPRVGSDWRLVLRLKLRRVRTAVWDEALQVWTADEIVSAVPLPVCSDECEAVALSPNGPRVLPPGVHSE